MEVGAAARMTGATKLNERSSRSHAVFILIVEQSRAPGAAGGADDEMDQFRGLTPGTLPAAHQTCMCHVLQGSKAEYEMACLAWRALLWSSNGTRVQHMPQHSEHCCQRRFFCWAGQRHDGAGECVMRARR